MAQHGATLRRFRTSRGVTQGELAAAVGCSKSSISRREAGITEIDEVELFALIHEIARIAYRKRAETPPAVVIDE